MKKLLLDIYYVWAQELKVVFKDFGVILLFFIAPLAYPILYSFIYNNETVHEVKAVVVDDSNTTLSREFKRMVDASPEVHVIGYALNMEEAREALRRKEAYGILYIPRDFSQKINTQQQTVVSVYSDMSSLLFYKALLLTATEVSLDMGADIRVMESGNGSREQDAATRQTITNESVAFYNPQNGFASFLIPAVLILIIQQTLFLGIATIVGTHRDKKRFKIASHTEIGKDVGALKLTIGKAFCYTSLYLLTSVWLLRVVPYLFKFPQIGDPWTIAAFILPFLLAATFFSMTLSYFCSQREFGMLLFVFTSVLFLFLSGVSWPWISMPAPLKAISYIFPSTPGIHAFIRINTMGATLPDVWFEYIVLWIQAGVYCITATFMYKWWIQNYDPGYRASILGRN